MEQACTIKSMYNIHTQTHKHRHTHNHRHIHTHTDTMAAGDWGAGQKLRTKGCWGTDTRGWAKSSAKPRRGSRPRVLTEAARLWPVSRFGI